MNNTLDDGISRAFFIERYDDFLALEQGASVQTSRAYKLDIARFVTYASVKGSKNPIDVGARTLREYVYHLKDLGLSPASIRRNISAVRSYFRFLVAEGHVVRDPSERLETPKKWRTLPDVLGVEEIEKLLTAPSLDEPMAFRDRAMLELAYGAGLRVSEWISLHVRDVLLQDHLVRVFGKGAKERLVPIGRRAIAAIAIYLRELRPKLEKGEGKGILFLNARGEPMSRMRSFTRLREACNAPVIFDATHSVQRPGQGPEGASGGAREYVPVLALSAIAAGAQGLFLETHPDPDCAPSDGPNMLPLSEMRSLLSRAVDIWARINQ